MGFVQKCCAPKTRLCLCSSSESVTSTVIASPCCPRRPVDAFAPPTLDLRLQVSDEIGGPIEERQFLQDLNVRMDSHQRFSRLRVLFLQICVVRFQFAQACFPFPPQLAGEISSKKVMVGKKVMCFP